MESLSLFFPPLPRAPSPFCRRACTRSRAAATSRPSPLWCHCSFVVS